MKKLWVDVPSGWKFGFPKLYDPENDGELSAWVYRNGYPKDRELHYHRVWEERGDEYDDRTDD